MKPSLRTANRNRQTVVCTEQIFEGNYFQTTQNFIVCFQFNVVVCQEGNVYKEK